MLSGAIVKFNDGALVSKILLPWELSAVHLDGLAVGSTREFVSEMFRKLGYDVLLDCIRIRKGDNTAKLNAHVDVGDVSAAKEFCSLLEAGKLTPPEYLGVLATPVYPALPSSTVKRRISCRKVSISWHKPTRFAWLNFGNEWIADKISKGFNRGINTVLGHFVEADAPKKSASGLKTSGHSNFPSNSVPWTVLLKNVPSNATVTQIQDSIPDNFKPRHIELDKNHHKLDPQDVSASVECLFRRIGAVGFDISLVPHGKRVKATARFVEEADAREAVKLFHDEPQDFMDDGKLTVQLISSSKFKISAPMYNIIKEQLRAPREFCTERHLKFKEFPNSDAKGFVTLRVEGEQAEAVKEATDKLETILTGKLIKHNEKVLWCPELANAATHQHLKLIQRQYGVLIVRDSSKKQLRFFGSREKYDLVRRALVERFTASQSPLQTIELDDYQFAWACRGGSEQIASTIGHGLASFDVVSEPKRIVITGSYEQYEIALRMLQGNKEEVQVKNKAGINQDCAVCWTEAENAVVTRCDHRYCLDCFEIMCTAIASGHSESPIHCEGDMGRCGKVFALPEIQEFLSSDALEKVLEDSFDSHIRHRPDQFRCCPTPDCGNVYRTSAIAKSHTCTGCLKVVCVACYSQHGDMSCADWKEHVSGGYAAFERFKKQMNIKDCPKCSTPIEKIEGCNHMTCGGCNAHICWVCLQTFTKDNQCYDHMNTVHGGIGIGDDDEYADDYMYDFD